MLSIHLSVHALSYSVIIINQSIHINLSAGTQNITGANVQITLEKQRKLFVQGYNLEVHNVQAGLFV